MTQHPQQNENYPMYFFSPSWVLVLFFLLYVNIRFEIFFFSLLQHEHLNDVHRYIGTVNGMVDFVLSLMSQPLLSISSYDDNLKIYLQIKGIYWNQIWSKSKSYFRRQTVTSYPVQHHYSPTVTGFTFPRLHFFFSLTTANEAKKKKRMPGRNDKTPTPESCRRCRNIERN